MVFGGWRYGMIRRWAEFRRANHVGRPWNRHGIVSDGSQIS
jgi:hypothetical protein